jgi:hypothetical protein
MGFRSLFVQMKLGFDMREQYDAEMDQRLPQEIERPLQALAAREALALLKKPESAGCAYLRLNVANVTFGASGPGAGCAHARRAVGEARNR